MSTNILCKHLKDMLKCIHTETKKVKLLSDSLEIDRDQIKLNSEQIDFNNWLNTDAEYLKEHLHGNFLNDIQLLHASWHEVYAKIYKLLYGEKRFLFGKRHIPKELNEQEQIKMKFYYEDIRDLSISLEHKIDILILRVSSSSELDDSYLDQISLLGA